MSHDDSIVRTYPERLARRMRYLKWKEDTRELGMSICPWCGVGRYRRDRIKSRSCCAGPFFPRLGLGDLPFDSEPRHSPNEGGSKERDDEAKRRNSTGL